MDKTMYLADDFKQVKESSDEAVIELLKAKDRMKQPESQGTTKQAERNEKDAKVQASRRSKKASQGQTNPTSNKWGRPTAILNTRIPQELSDLLDDMIYRSKKAGSPTTKQAVTIEALTRFVLSRKR